MINADNMQSWAYLLAPTFQFVNTAGKPLTEGWLEVYIAGTRDKYYCASDFNGTLHPFQIPLDSLGANIVLANPDQAYDVYVYNKYGSLIMSRYHVSPGMAGGSGVLNITITSEDGTVSVNNDGNGNFDLSIQDTVDRIEALEQAVSGLSADSTVGYAIAHAYTVELDGSFDLINDAVTGIGYTPNMDGFRLKSGHVYQFNFNALFENGEFDRNCSGKLYLEGPNTIAQEWKFDLDDSYYHSQSINGSTVLVTPNDLNYYDVKLKLAWDVDYPNKPNVDLNKISIVDITTILKTNSASGTGGDYIAGDGIFINDETNVISVDMDYINSHLNIDASEIIASAVNIATAYTDARVTSVSGDLVNLIAEVSASIPTGTVTQVQSDWTELDSSSPAYIQHKPDLSVYATHTEVSGVSAVLNERINDVSASIPELPEEEEVEFEEIDLSDYALASAIPDVSDFVTHSEVSAVSSNLVNYVNSVSGDITNYVDESIVSAINVATGSFEQVQSDWTEDDTNDPSYIQNKPNEIEIVAGQNIGIFSDATTITIAASATDLSGYATHSEVSAVSGILETEIQIVSAAIGEQVPNVSIQSPSGTLVVTETVSGNNKIYSIDVAPTSGIEYGQFYATNITGAATMSRTKGNIDITNDGKIKLKKGQSYHVTVRGRYNQTVLKDNYTYASYIEYVTNNSININVDESRSGSQYFELSYDLFKLNSDTDYYVFFTLDDATVNDLFIEIHSLANVGGNGSSGGSSPEYDAGYGIQILNNVISVSGIAPQIQSDWAQTNTTSVDYIKNKPEEYGLLAGDNISITASGNNFVISSTATASSGVTYQAGYGIDITDDTISVDASIIPEQQVNSDWTATSGVAEILNKPNESELIAGAGVSITASGSNYIISAIVTGSPVISGYVTETELQTVSGNIISQIPDVSNLATKQEVATVSGMIPDISGLATNADLQIVSAAIPDVSNLATKTEVQSVEADVQIVSAAIPTLPSEEEVEFEELDLSDYALASSIPDVSNFVTETELETVSGNIVNQIPDVSNFVTGPTVSAIVDEALVDVPTGVSGVVAGDGISITASGSNYVISCDVTVDVTRADLVSVSGTLESQIQTVSGAIPDISDLATEAELQIVSAAIPTLPDEEEVEFEELDLSDYALASSIPDVSNLASKSEVNAVSGTLQTEIVAISGAMVDVPTGVSGVVAGQGIAITASGSDYIISCTVTGGGASYTAGDYIGITDNTISVTGITDLVAGNAITITTSGASAIISSTGEAQVQSDWNVTDSNSKAYIKNKPTIPAEQIQSDWNQTNTSSKDYIKNKPTIHTYSGASGITISNDTVSLDNPIGLVAGDNITITVSGVSAIIAAQVSGGSSYSAGSGINITNDVISIDNTVALKSEIPVVSGFATKTEVATVSGTLEGHVQTVSAAIPTLPDEEEVEFVEVDLSDYALASAIPVVTGFATEVELQTVSAAIPDTSTLATKNELTTGLSNKQNTLTGITDVQVVQTLPVSPVSSVLYLIPET